jgi:hypothetical protein
MLGPRAHATQDGALNISLVHVNMDATHSCSPHSRNQYLQHHRRRQSCQAHAQGYRTGERAELPPPAALLLMCLCRGPNPANNRGGTGHTQQDRNNHSIVHNVATDIDM